MGDPAWLEFVLGIQSPLIVSYHNMTPAHFFEPWDATLADHLRFGRLTLPVLAPRTALAMADSAFSADELSAAGYERPEVGGLLLDTSSLLEAQPDTDALIRSASQSGPKILAVGQLFPHKRVDVALLAFRHLRFIRPGAHLVLAGASRLRPYRHAIETLIHDLGLGASVTVTGEISASELSAHYRTADLLLMASEHEGFSVPLVEAMSFGVPIVARRFGAVPETLGDAGVIVDGGRSSAAIAIAADEVLSRHTAREALGRRGVDRARRFSLDEQRAGFLELLSRAPL
jgi:glycosyltransferase involved in cell wall biosynthesis